MQKGESVLGKGTVLKCTGAWLGSALGDLLAATDYYLGAPTGGSMDFGCEKTRMPALHKTSNMEQYNTGTGQLVQ